MSMPGGQTGISKQLHPDLSSANHNKLQSHCVVSNISNNAAAETTTLLICRKPHDVIKYLVKDWVTDYKLSKMQTYSYCSDESQLI